MALIEDFQRDDQLAAEQRAASAFVSQRRERRRHRIAALGFAETAFDPPQRDDEARLDIEALLYPLQQGRVLGQVAPGILDTLLGHDLVHELGEGQLVIGLMPVELDDARQELYVAESEIDRTRPDALRDRIAPQPGEKTVEITFRCYCPSAPQRHGQ